MVRSLFFFFAVLFLAGCQRDWTNAVIEKRLYRDGYYVHAPSKRHTPVYAYVPPVPYPQIQTTITGNQPVYTVITTDSTPVYYPTPYIPPPPVTVYTYTYTPVPDTIMPSSMSGGGIINTNDSVPPVEHWATGTPVHSDSVMDQPVPVMDTVFTNLIAKADSMYVDTTQQLANEKHRTRRSIDGEMVGWMQAGMITGPQSYGMPVKINSHSFAFGTTFMTKIYRNDKLAIDLGFRNYRYNIDQDRPKVFPLNTSPHTHEKISFRNFSFGLSDHFTFCHAEEKPAYWMEAGVFGEATFHSSDIYSDVTDDTGSPLADHVEVTTRNVHLNYIHKFNYGVQVKGGYGRYAGFVRWRVSDLVKKSDDVKADLPALVVGMEINFGE